MDCCENCKHVLKRQVMYGGEIYTMHHCTIQHDVLTVCDMRLVEHEILARKSVCAEDVCDEYVNMEESSNESDEIRETED